MTWGIWGKQLSTTQMIFNEFFPNLVKLKEVKVGKAIQSPESRVEYHSYYANGNIQEVSKKDGSRIVYIWGYDETHARDLKASRDLVRWLGSERPAIRRRAYFHVLRLTGQQDEYRPNLTPDRMVSFRKRWERQVEKHGTLLKN